MFVFQCYRSRFESGLWSRIRCIRSLGSDRKCNCTFFKQWMLQRCHLLYVYREVAHRWMGVRITNPIRQTYNVSPEHDMVVIGPVWPHLKPDRKLRTNWEIFKDLEVSLNSLGAEKHATILPQIMQLSGATGSNRNFDIVRCRNEHIDKVERSSGSS